MGDSEKKSKKKPTAKKTSWFKGLKGQLKSISWPTPETVGKQTAAVVFISVILGVLITVIDVVFRFGLGFLVK